MSRDILVVAHFTGDYRSASNNRFNYLCQLFTENGDSVELVTSSFSHRRKKQRDKSDLFPDYKTTLLHEPDYSDNVSLKRLISHHLFARNVRDFLSKRKVPDVVYCAFPSIDTAKYVSEFCKKNPSVNFIIDIQDIWPEAYYFSGLPRILNRLIFFYSHIKVKNILDSAHKIISVSETYLEVAARSVSLKNKATLIAYIGTTLLSFKESVNKETLENTNGVFRIIYAGTLGYSYDLKTLLRAYAKFKTLTKRHSELLIAGTGPLEYELKDYSSKLNCGATFTGDLPYPELVKVLLSSHLAINSLSAGAPQSIINKHADYSAAGLPVISTQETDEYKELLTRYNFGFNCTPGDYNGVAQCMLKLMDDEGLRLLMAQNSLRAGRQLFERDTIYQRILKFLEN